MEDQALNHLSILLSQVVHQSSAPGSLRERLNLMAEDFARRYLGELNFIVFVFSLNLWKSVRPGHSTNKLLQSQKTTRFLNSNNLLKNFKQKIVFFLLLHNQNLLT